MFFSIVVPVYNVEKYLDECIQSIVSQCVNMPNDCEIILVDDGSIDSSGIICDKYCSKYPEIIKVYHNVNQGLLLTRRFGYKQTSGKYIINCDSDDKLENGTLKLLKETIISNNEPDVILYNHYLYDGKEKTFAYKNLFTNENVCKVLREDVLKEFLLGHYVVSMCCKCYKRECVELGKDYTNYARISNGEDSLQSLEIFDYAKTYVYLNEALYYYRMGSGMTQKYDANYYFSFKKVIEEVEKRKGDWNLPEFEKLLSIKVMTTVGRAVTQSRFKNWDTVDEHIEYLRTIREDKMFETSILFLCDVKKMIQKNYIMILSLLNKKSYIVVVTLLRIKNSLDFLLRKLKSYKLGKLYENTY